MSQIDQGPATGNAEFVFGGTPAASVEFHAAIGTNPLPAGLAPFVDPGASTYLDTAVTKGAVTNATNTTVNFGTLGTGIKFCIPA